MLNDPWAILISVIELFVLHRTIDSIMSTLTQPVEVRSKSMIQRKTSYKSKVFGQTPYIANGLNISWVWVIPLDWEEIHYSKISLSSDAHLWISLKWSKKNLASGKRIYLDKIVLHVKATKHVFQVSQMDLLSVSGRNDAECKPCIKHSPYFLPPLMQNQFILRGHP